MSFLLIGILLSSTIGISIHEHYCQESLVTTSIGIDLTAPCSCEMPMPNDCCQDVSTFYAFTGLFNLVSATVNSQPHFKLLAPINFNLNVLATANQPINFYVIKDTSYPSAESKVYLKIQSFLL